MDAVHRLNGGGCTRTRHKAMRAVGTTAYNYSVNNNVAGAKVCAAVLIFGAKVDMPWGKTALVVASVDSILPQEFGVPVNVRQS